MNVIVLGFAGCIVCFQVAFAFWHDTVYMKHVKNTIHMGDYVKIPFRRFRAIYDMHTWVGNKGFLLFSEGEDICFIHIGVFKVGGKFLLLQYPLDYMCALVYMRFHK